MIGGQFAAKRRLILWSGYKECVCAFTWMNSLVFGVFWFVVVDFFSGPTRRHSGEGWDNRIGFYSYNLKYKWQIREIRFKQDRGVLRASLRFNLLDSPSTDGFGNQYSKLTLALIVIRTRKYIFGVLRVSKVEIKQPMNLHLIDI